MSILIQVTQSCILWTKSLLVSCLLKGQSLRVIRSILTSCHVLQMDCILTLVFTYNDLYFEMGLMFNLVVLYIVYSLICTVPKLIKTTTMLISTSYLVVTNMFSADGIFLLTYTQSSDINFVGVTVDEWFFLTVSLDSMPRLERFLFTEIELKGLDEMYVFSTQLFMSPGKYRLSFATYGHS